MPLRQLDVLGSLATRSLVQAPGSREQLSRCLDGLREGDVLVLDELSRLSRKGMVEMLVVVNDLHDWDRHQIPGWTAGYNINATRAGQADRWDLGYASEIELKHCVGVARKAKLLLEAVE